MKHASNATPSVQSTHVPSPAQSGNDTDADTTVKTPPARSNNGTGIDNSAGTLSEYFAESETNPVDMLELLYSRALSHRLATDNKVFRARGMQHQSHQAQAGHLGATEKDPTHSGKDESDSRTGASNSPATSPPFENLFASSDIVALEVGEEPKQQVFHASMVLLSYYSPMIAVAFRGHWKESNKGRISFPACDPQIFHEYLLLLHTRDFADPPPGPDDDGEIRLAALYELAEYLQDWRTKNEVVRRVFGLCFGHGEEGLVRLTVKNVWCPSSAFVWDICNCTPSSSPMRTFLLELYSNSFTIPTVKQRDLPKDFEKDLVGMIMDKYGPEVTMPLQLAWYLEGDLTK